MGREQLVSDMAREVREAEEAGWPKDKEECVDCRGEGSGGWSWSAGGVRGGGEGRAVREGLSKAGCWDGGTKGALPVYWSHCFPYLYVE